MEPISGRALAASVPEAGLPAKECHCPSAATSCEVKLRADREGPLEVPGRPAGFMAPDLPAAVLFPEKPCQPGELSRDAPRLSHDHGLEEDEEGPRPAPPYPPRPLKPPG